MLVGIWSANIFSSSVVYFHPLNSLSKSKSFKVNKVQFSFFFSFRDYIFSSKSEDLFASPRYWRFSFVSKSFIVLFISNNFMIHFDLMCYNMWQSGFVVVVCHLAYGCLIIPAPFVDLLSSVHSFHISESYVCLIYNAHVFLLYTVGGIEKITSILLEAGDPINIQLCRILQFGRTGWPHEDHSSVCNRRDKRYPHNDGILESCKRWDVPEPRFISMLRYKKVTKLL